MEPQADPNPPPSAGSVRRAAQLATPRMRREMATMAAMLRIYCGDHGHADATDGLCSDCAGLLDYANKRLASCPYGADKPTCARCPVHCYGPAQREHARVVMRHAGPRMLLRHPLLAVGHLLDGRRPVPPDPRAAIAARARQARAGGSAATATLTSPASAATAPTPAVETGAPADAPAAPR